VTEQHCFRSLLLKPISNDFERPKRSLYFIDIFFSNHFERLLLTVHLPPYTFEPQIFETPPNKGKNEKPFNFKRHESFTWVGSLPTVEGVQTKTERPPTVDGNRSNATRQQPCSEHQIFYLGKQLTSEFFLSFS
jgi:hypothetical protein